VRRQLEKKRHHGAVDRRAFLYVAAGVALLAPEASHAQRAEKAGAVEDVRGDAFVVDRNERRSLAQAAPVFINDMVGTGAESRLTMLLGKDTTLRLGAQARLILDRVLVSAGGEITLQSGPILFSRPAGSAPEGQIDPAGPGWMKNLNDQFARAKAQGFTYIELDNPDAYDVADVVGAVARAETYGLKVVAKNPGLVEGDRKSYVAHRNVVGIIVEKDAGTPDEMDALRRSAGKPTLPVWFVAFGGGKAWADKTAQAAGKYRNMGVTYSTKGEYANATDVLVPVKSA
jgi:hypothetical protein